MKKITPVLILILAIAVISTVFASEHKQNGYRGIWYSNQRQDDQYVWKYSGGLGTYTANHIPMAIYVPEQNKTFFVYGGTKPLTESRRLLEMISYYDHETGMVPKPTLVMEKGTNDAHHNPALSIDKDGYLWVFCSAHGRQDGFIYRSNKPYSIEDGFEQILQKEFTYPQIWYFDDFGFVFLFTKYTKGRECYISTSKDGINWTEDVLYAGFGGHYQSSWVHKNKVGTSYNWHPPVGGLNARTNIYYMETSDYGKTWTNVEGKVLQTPLDDPVNDALVREYQSEGWRCYINDVNFDAQGRPAIFYNITKGYESGPKHGERIMMVARWTGKEWLFSEVCKTDHNYDMGSLYIEDDGTWRVIAPTFGPQPWSTGGEVIMMVSKDKGKTWTKARDVTKNSEMNHHYVRRALNGHPDFYAFWADGHAFEQSESRIYFSNKEGDVSILPFSMSRDFMMPHIYYKPE